MSPRSWPTRITPSRSPGCWAATTPASSSASSRRRGSPTISCGCPVRPGSISRSSTTCTPASPTSTFSACGPNPRDLAALTTAIDMLAESAEWFVLSGSVPADVPNDIYATLIARLKLHRRTVVLDASGLPLRAAIEAAPDIIKPNIDELQELLGRQVVGDDAIVAAARELLSRGIRMVAVSMGPRGAIFVEGTGRRAGGTAEDRCEEHGRRGRCDGRGFDRRETARSRSERVRPARNGLFDRSARRNRPAASGAGGRFVVCARRDDPAI